MEIEDHALIYALIARRCVNDYAEGEDLIRVITQLYGRKRGMRMAKLAKKNDEQLNIDTFLIHSEWKGRPAENISRLEFKSDKTISRVSKCRWFDTWAKYDLEDYGKYYCRYIDKAICDGFDGEFGLTVESTLMEDNRFCEFVWDQAGDEEYVNMMKKRNGNKYIYDFSFHSGELLESAEYILGEKVIKEIIAEYRRLKGGYLASDKMS